MSWLSNYLKKRKLDWLAKMAQELLKVFLGKVAFVTWEMVKANVAKAEAQEVPGPAKFKLAYEGTLKDLGGYKDIPKWLLTMAIEAAVGLIDSKLT